MSYGKRTRSVKVEVFSFMDSPTLGTSSRYSSDCAFEFRYAQWHAIIFEHPRWNNGYSKWWKFHWPHYSLRLKFFTQGCSTKVGTLIKVPTKITVRLLFHFSMSLWRTLFWLRWTNFNGYWQYQAWALKNHLKCHFCSFGLVFQLTKFINLSRSSTVWYISSLHCKVAGLVFFENKCVSNGL